MHEEEMIDSEGESFATRSVCSADFEGFDTVQLQEKDDIFHMEQSHEEV